MNRKFKIKKKLVDSNVNRQIHASTKLCATHYECPAAKFGQLLAIASAWFLSG